MKPLLKQIMCSVALIAASLLSPTMPQAEEKLPAGSGESISGTIMETMNAAGYTYLQIDTASGPVWAAIPEHDVTVGSQVSLQPGMVMNDFHSSTFDKTFSTIIFSPGLSGQPATKETAAAPAPSGEQSFAAAVAAERGEQQQSTKTIPRSGGSMAAMAPFIDVQVDKASGENGFTVAEIFAKAAELNGKVVRVRGQVVKFRTKIMGRNWVHLQDGSGDPINNTHDLVVTTDQEVSENQVVTFEGTVAADKDFGAGYQYAVLIEQAVATEKQ